MSPLYRYRAPKGGCGKCGGEGFEELQGVDEASLEACPDCGGPVERALPRPGRDWATDKRLGETRTNADYRRMGLKKYRKKPGGGYEREA